MLSNKLYKIKNVLYDSSQLKGIVSNEITLFSKKIKKTCPNNIALHDSLKENLFALFTCIMNKIPIFLCGKPGCSKTLSFELLLISLTGEKSKDDFFKKLPSLLPFYFQGSLSTTSEEVKNIFKVVKEKSKNLKKIIPVLFFDELGLAENSKNNPLKSLHSELEYNEEKFAFVGISNIELDASKLNRGIYLLRPDLNLEELIETSDSIAKAFNINYNQSLFQTIAKC